MFKVGGCRIPDKMALIFQHFVLPDNQDEYIRGVCKHCSTSIAGSRRVTSNFVTHLKRKHQAVYLQHVLSKPPPIGAASPTSISQPSASLSFSDQIPITKFTTQPTASPSSGRIPVAKYATFNPRQSYITDALITFIAGDLIPLSIVDSHRFCTLLNRLDPSYSIPSQKHLDSQLLQEKCGQIQVSINKMLQHAESVCLTVDIQKAKQEQKNFIRITGHFIKKWTITSVMFSCAKLLGEQTAENVHKFYEDTTNRFGVGNKVNYIVINNKSHLNKSFSLPGFEEMAKEAALDIKMSDSESEENDETQDSHTTEDTEHGLPPSEDLLTYLPEHAYAFAQSLEWVVKTAIMKDEQANKAFLKAAIIFSCIKKSPSAAELLQGEQKLNNTNGTSWTTQVKMVHCILNIPEEKLDQLVPVQFTKADCDVLQDLCDILGPFEEATELVQQENVVSASLVVPCVRGLRKQLETMTTNYHPNLLMELKSLVQQQLTPYEQSDVFLMATTLDPRYKLQWCTYEEAQFRQNDLQLKVNALSANTILPYTIAESLPTPQKKRKLFGFMEPGFMTDQGSPTTENILEYLRQPCIPEDMDPLQYWKMHQSTFPYLAKLAARYLGVPASYDPVDKLFSKKDRIFQPETCDLKDSILEKFLFIGCNAHIE